jgi:fatty acid desaturase
MSLPISHLLISLFINGLTYLFSINTFYHLLYFQIKKTATIDKNERAITIQKAWGWCCIGIGTFIENALTTRVGTIIAMVIILRVFIRMFRLLLIMDTLASIREASILEYISACLKH